MITSQEKGDSWAIVQEKQSSHWKPTSTFWNLNKPEVDDRQEEEYPISVKQKRNEVKISFCL